MLFPIVWIDLGIWVIKLALDSWFDKLEFDIVKVVSGKLLQIVNVIIGAIKDDNAISTS